MRAFGKLVIPLAAALVVLASTADSAPIEKVNDVIWRSERCCGVNCAYVMLKTHEIQVDYMQLQRSLLDSSELPSLTDLRDAMREAGLPVEIGKTTADGLTAIGKPVIAHLDLVGARGTTGGHFVIVLSIDNNNIQYLDGTTALIQTKSTADFMRRWSGYVVFRDAGPLQQAKPLLISAVLGIGVGLALAWGARLLKSHLSLMLPYHSPLRPLLPVIVSSSQNSEE